MTIDHILVFPEGVDRLFIKGGWEGVCGLIISDLELGEGGIWYIRNGGGGGYVFRNWEGVTAVIEQTNKKYRGGAYNNFFK